MTTTIFLVRHGHYESPTPVAPYRLPGFHLSEQGKSDAEKLSRLLAAESISAVFTSPMERTQETAVIVARPHNLTPIADDRLLEVKSPLQGKTIEEIHALGGWNWQIYDTPWYQSHAGESPKKICLRIVSVIDEKRREYAGRGICLVSHGDPIMLAAAYYRGLELTTERLMAMQPYVAMAGGFRLVFDDTRVQGVYPIVVT